MEYTYCDTDIAVIGMAGRFPEADNLKTFWHNLVSGRESIRPLPETRKEEIAVMMGMNPEDEYVRGGYLDQISYFDPQYFQISTEEGKYLDPQQRLLLELVEETVREAGFASNQLAGRAVGVFMADSKNVYGERIDTTMPMGLVNALDSALAGRIAYTFDLCGPALTIDTACSSSLVAIHYACQALRNGECELALAGGVSVNVEPLKKEVISKLAVASQNEQVRAFDRDGDGTIGGEGGAVLLLKLLKHAFSDGDQIHGIIKGSGVNSDGRRSNGLSAPNQYAQAEVIRQAITRAGIEPETISYIETHGTGTKLGDPIEVEGLRIAFDQYSLPKQSIPIGSLKTNIGHLNSAAGVASVVKVLLAFKHRQLPPSLNFAAPNPEIDFIHSPVYVNTHLQNWQAKKPLRAGVTSLGLIGTNVHLILEEAPHVSDCQSCQDTSQLIALSGKDEHSLIQLADELHEQIAEQKELSLQDLAFTVNTGLKDEDYRVAIIADSKTQLLQELEDIKERIVKVTGNTRLSPVFIYPDLVDTAELSIDQIQSIGKAEPLFQHHYNQCIEFIPEAFKSAIDDLKSESGQSVHSKISPERQIALNNVNYIAFQYAYTQLLSGYGVKPGGSLGMGLGKLTSDLLQGKMELEKAIQLALEYTAPPQPVDQNKLRGVLEMMQKNNHQLFVQIGLNRQLHDQINDILGIRLETGEVLLLNIDMQNQSRILALSKLYLRGYSFNWEQIYTGKGCRRTSLHKPTFCRKSYLLQGNLPKILSPSPGPELYEAKSSRVSEVSFADILDVIQSVISQRVELDKDFEETGGDSISMLQIVQILKNRYHVTILMEIFYKTSTVRELIHQLVEMINNNLNVSQFAKPEIQNSIYQADLAKLTLSRHEPEKILLTGVTGFVGSHLLKELLDETESEVFCLIRARQDCTLEERFLERFNFYFGDQYDHLLTRRIHLLEGELSAEKLGLGASLYHDLAQTIDTVIHSAADVRHFGKYSSLAGSNIIGTQNLLDWSLSGKKKVFHHISTLAVAGYHPERRALREQDLDIDQNFVGNVYAHSKFDSEKVVEEARKRGLTASVYRLGNIVGRFSDGVFQQNIETNLFYNLLKGMILVGKISPDFLAEARLELIPIDTSCQIMTQLMLYEELQGTTFHLTNPRGISLLDLSYLINGAGGSIQSVTQDEFYNYVHQLVQKTGFIQEISWIINAMPGKNDATVDDRAMEYEATFTFRLLERLQLSWPDITQEFMTKLLRYCEEIGYFRL